MESNIQLTADESLIGESVSLPNSSLSPEGIPEVNSTEGTAATGSGNQESSTAILQDEVYLASRIGKLWEVRRAHGDAINGEKARLHRVDGELGELLFHLKLTLAKTGRNGKWTAWLRENKVARASADRLVQRFESTLPGFKSPHESDKEPTEADILKLSKAVWSRIHRVLTTDEAVVHFIRCIVIASGVAHEWREEGFVILHTVPEVVAELSHSTSSPDPPSQPPDSNDEPSEEAVAEVAAVGSATQQVAGDGNNYA
jgi:hypothetical protein